MPDQPASAVQCECAQRGMVGGKAHPLCPVHGVHDGPEACFEVDGARVRGNPDMSDESREALRVIIGAAGRLIEGDAAPDATCPFCDLPGRLMGSGERYVCDNRHYWRVLDDGVVM